MKKFYIIPLALVMAFMCITSGCGQSKEVESDAGSSVSSISLLNIKSEVSSQIEALAKQYQAETGVAVNIITVQSGVDAQATLKGCYLSDQMPMPRQAASRWEWRLTPLRMAWIPYLPAHQTGGE